MLKIGVDVMGGDYAPQAAVQGAMMAADAIDSGNRIVLFGNEPQIRAILAAEHFSAQRSRCPHNTNGR